MSCAISVTGEPFHCMNGATRHDTLAGSGKRAPDAPDGGRGHVGSQRHDGVLDAVREKALTPQR